MEQRLSKIAAFIDSLPVDAEIGDCQSVLLPTNMDVLGGTTNGGNCVNPDEGCVGAINGRDCKNATGQCSGSTNNGDCDNDHHPVRPPLPNHSESCAM